LAKYVLVQEKKLSNKKFVSNAPAEVVNKEKEKLTVAKIKLSKLNQQLQNLK